MSAADVLPSLGQIETLDTRHLADLALHFGAEADRIEDNFNRAHQQVEQVQWQGQAYEAALGYTAGARTAAREHSQRLRGAAIIARTGDARLLAAQRKVLDLVDDARRAGFIVSDQLAVSAFVPNRRIADAMLLQPQANMLTDTIRIHAASLLDIDRDVAQQLDALAVSFREKVFTNLPATPFDGLPPLPPPLSPEENDDPWEHGGDRRWKSIASAGVKQKYVAMALLEMERNNQTTAQDLLSHYLENSGEAVELPADLLDRWLSDTVNGYADEYLPPAEQTSSHLQSVASNAWQVAQKEGKPVTVSGNTPWTPVAGSDGDSVRSLGHFGLSTAYSMTVNPDGTYSATYRSDVYDWYNFATFPYDGVAQSISSAAHDLQAAGFAQDFVVTGSGSVQQTQGKVQ